MANLDKGRRDLLLAAGALLVTVVACGDDDETNETSSSSSTGGGGSGGSPAGTGGSGGSPAGTGGSGGTGGAGGGDPICAAGAMASDISNNHNTPHTVMDVPTADIEGGVEMTYQVDLGGGMGGHTHEFTLTAADLTTLATTGTVTVTSTTGGNNDHSHDITLTC